MDNVKKIMQKLAESRRDIFKRLIWRYGNLFRQESGYNLFTNSQALVSWPKTVRHEEKKKEAVATIEDKIENKTFQVGMFVVSYRNSLKMNSNSMELCVGVVREGKLHFPLLK